MSEAKPHLSRVKVPGYWKPPFTEPCETFVWACGFDGGFQSHGMTASAAFEAWRADHRIAADWLRSWR